MSVSPCRETVPVMVVPALTYVVGTQMRSMMELGGSRYLRCMNNEWTDAAYNHGILRISRMDLWLEILRHLGPKFLRKEAALTEKSLHKLPVVLIQETRAPSVIHVEAADCDSDIYNISQGRLKGSSVAVTWDIAAQHEAEHSCASDRDYNLTGRNEAPIFDNRDGGKEPTTGAKTYDERS